MSNGIVVGGVPQRRHRLWGVMLGLLILAALLVIIAFLWYGRMGRSGPSMPKALVHEPVDASAFLPASNGARIVSLPIDEQGREERARILKALQEQEQFNKRLLQDLEALRKEKRDAPPHSSAAREAKAPTIKRAPAYFVTNKSDGQSSHEATYALAPGATKLSCLVETKFSSDLDSYFTARLKRAVMDTATGQQELIPQGSTILGKASGESLVFGNERLPTLSLSVAFPDGRSVDLGDSPVMDREGVTGLVSRVSHHWGRNIAAALLMGVLRGGQQAIQHEIATSSGSAIVTTPGQVGQQLIGKAIDTRPTVEVDAGEPCTVLLLKELRLPAYRHQS